MNDPKKLASPNAILEALFASVAWLEACGPGDLRVAGSIIDRGR